ncbi:MAG: Gfo/Idh/MocA family oxidoreductase [Planctomycetaceae bacterium]|nr:Gfo/Idh/MocA family oxidoreductase [Planctomycetaceae bacterium]
MAADSKATGTSSVSRRTFLHRAAVLGAATGGALSLARSVHAAGSGVIKVGLIGCGGRGSGAAANAMNAGADIRLVAMGDVLQERIDTARPLLKEKYPDQFVVDDAHAFVGFDAYQKVIDSGVDAVAIACTSHFHPVFLKAAVDAGKHVFVEKPAAVDPTGVRLALAASEAAKEKGLSLVSGFCWRYDDGVCETIKRIRDGAIGDVVAVQATRLGGPYVLRERKPEWNEMQYQFQNWYHFNWLSGSDPVQNLVHQIDNASWVLGDAAPAAAWGLGGRQVCTDPDRYGDELDHHAIVYEYPDGKRIYAHGRHIPGCFNQAAVIALGTKGQAFMPSRPHIEGENPWQYQAPETPVSMTDAEHKVLFQSIRDGKPVNDGRRMCHTTTLSIMGEMVCCTGKQTTWEQVMNSPLNYALPRYGWDVEPPIKPGPDGHYPAVLPGITELG